MNPAASISLLRAQATALASTLRLLVSDHPPLEHSPAGQHLLALSQALADPLLPPEALLQTVQQGVQELKDLVTAYHEAGHLLAFFSLTPRHRLRLDHVYFSGRIPGSTAQAGVASTWISEPRWPDPTQVDEIIREIACLLAGKQAEPQLTGSVQVEGSDLDDRLAVAELLRLLPEPEQPDAEDRALSLLNGVLDPALVSTLASQLYGRWIQGETVIPFRAIEAFLPGSSAGVV